jgi:hypothetical protein
MSRGLGTLQREVLAACDDWRDPVAWPSSPRWHGGEIHGGTVYCKRFHGEWTPPADVIEVSAVTALVARRRDTGRSEAFNAAVARAVRTLVARGLLIPIRNCGTRQRFYSLAGKCSEELHSAYDQRDLDDDEGDGPGGGR